MSAPVEILDALAALVRAGTPLVVVGVGGINFYAHDASQVVATEDVDVLLAPATFRLGDVEIRVGRLEKLLHAKRMAGRPKDLEFLRLYAA